MDSETTTYRHRAVIATCARWETHTITEWLLYHQSIGFDHVYIYCNDDDPIDLYGELLPFLRVPNPFVSFVHFPYQGQQFYMLLHFLTHRKHEAEWIAFLDVDEFLCLPGLDNIKLFLKSCDPAWDSIQFNWSLFGNSGYAERPIGSVLTHLTRRQRDLDFQTKNVTRSACIDVSLLTLKHYFWHQWYDLLKPGSVSVNVLGEPMNLFWGDDHGKGHVTQPDVAAQMRARGVIYHYAFKSERDVHRRFARGTVADFAEQAKWGHLLEEGQRAAFLAEKNEVEDTYLADYWRRFLAGVAATAVVPALPALPNVALGKPAMQSSVCEFSSSDNPALDAAGAVSGRTTGHYQQHTNLEDRPWWHVDLEALHDIAEIRIYNRVDPPGTRDRLRSFEIARSPDGEAWATIHRHDGFSPIGGVDGNPMILRPGSLPPSRYVRITALDRTVLHLDQVEVYGREAVAIAEPNEPAAATPLRPMTAALDEVIDMLGRQLAG